MEGSEHSERELHTQRCEEHGLRFDPRRSTGCLRCAREAAPKTSSRRSGRIGAGLLVALAGLLVWRIAMVSDDKSPAAPAAQPAEAEETTAAAPVAAGPIDPTPYESGLRALEAMLYGDDRSWIYGDALRERILTISGGIRSGDPESDARARRELAAYAEAFRVVEDAGFDAVDVDAARERWESLRDRIFSPAPWFDPTRTAEVLAQEAEAQAEIAGALRGHAQDLARFIDEVEFEVMRLREVAEIVTAEDREAVREWEEWARAWDAQLTDRLGSLPPHPGWNGDPNLVQAHQALGNARQELNLMAVTSGDWPTGAESMRRQRFDSARALITEANQFLDASGY